MKGSVLPKDIKNWDIIKHEPNSSLAPSTIALKDPNVYGYYLNANDNKWHPHRKPTIPEILNNQFK